MQTANADLRHQPSPLRQLAGSTADPLAIPVKFRLRVRCSHCELTQWEAEACRRCHHPLPAPLVEYVEVEKPVPVFTKELVEVPVIREVLVPVEQPCLKCSGLSRLNLPSVEVPNNLPLLADIERTLIKAAIERSGGDRQKAAHMLGIGKTTIYRKLKEYQTPMTG
jgi:hypothetical protein